MSTGEENAKISTACEKQPVQKGPEGRTDGAGTRRFGDCQSARQW
jgi:hypothetical protein